MTSQTPGQRFLRTALLAEAGTNIFTVIPMFVAPGAVLSYLVKSPSQITPLSKSLVQWT